jgi:L-proline amide hydrolase
MTVAATKKGRLAFGDFRTWYRITGTAGGDRPALVVLHGGPGSTHDYLLSLAALAAEGWPVVHYDQLGSGGSTHLPERGADFWSVDLFRAELANLLRGLGVGDDYVLFGHSWGGVLAARHAADRPAGLRGLVVADSPASYVLWRAEMTRLRAALPDGTDEILRAHEAAGTTSSAAYHRAAREFIDRHVCRVKPWPRDYRASHLEMADDPTVYAVMNGPSEFHVTGSLRDYSVEEFLPRIEVPTLVLTGRHDEATPATVQPFLDLVPDVRSVVFEESSHVPHLEEPERFHEVLTGFLTRLGARTPERL